MVLIILRFISTRYVVLIHQINQCGSTTAFPKFKLYRVKCSGATGHSYSMCENFLSSVYMVQIVAVGQ